MAASQTTFTQGVLPSWYTNYAQDIIANQTAVANRPYTAYDAPRIAGFNDVQNVGQAATLGAAGSYAPALGLATAATADALGRNVADNINPMLSAATKDQTQGALSGLGSANSIAAQSTQNSGTAAATPWLNQSGNYDLFAQPTPFWNQSADYTGQSTDPMAIAMADPYLREAGQTGVSNIDDYLNPYTQHVVRGFGDVAARNLRELLPQLEGRYIGAGQFGGHAANGTFQPTGLNTDSLRAMRDIMDTTGQQQMQAMQQGYTQALGARQTDLARQAQLAQQAGQLGQAQQGALAQAGQQYNALGQNIGALGQAQQANALSVGSQFGNLATAQQQAIAEQARLAQQGATAQGQLTQNQQAMQLQAAQIAAQTQQNDLLRQLAAGQQLGALANQTQQQGLTGASAITGVGGQLQALDQANLDLAYRDFQNQQNYPQQQVTQSAQTLGAIAPAVPQGQIQYTSRSVPTTGTLQTIAGLAATAGGLGAFGGNGGTATPTR